MKLPVAQVGHHLLLCRVGSRVCGLPFAHVIETFRPLPIEPLAGMPAFVRGLSVVRGAAVPVVDVAMLLAAAEDSQPFERFISVRAGKHVVVLGTGAVIGIRDVRTVAADELPPLLEQALAPYVEAIRTLDVELLVVLRASRVLPDTVWSALGLQGAA